MPLTVVITGAAGNIGGKLRAYLRARGDYVLRLVDLDPRGDPETLTADLAVYDERWCAQFDGADVVVHLAANRDPAASWNALLGPNVDATLNVYGAAARHGVKRVVLASSVWAVAARFEGDGLIFAGEPSPGGNAYGATKLFAERIGKAYARTHGVSTVALRIGGCRPGSNEPSPASAAWEDMCWLSNADLCRGLEAAIRAEGQGFMVANLTSANPGSRWSLAEAREFLDFEAADGYAAPPRPRTAIARKNPRRLFARLRALRDKARPVMVSRGLG